MRKHLQLALMATVIATFLSLTPYVQAEAGDSIITTTTDDYGRTVYVNEFLPAAKRRSEAPARESSLVYWSVVEHRWKPVPSAHVRAARSAADEVNRYLGSSRRASSLFN